MYQIQLLCYLDLNAQIDTASLLSSHYGHVTKLHVLISLTTTTSQNSHSNHYLHLTTSINTCSCRSASTCRESSKQEILPPSPTTTTTAPPSTFHDFHHQESGAILANVMQSFPVHRVLRQQLHRLTGLFTRHVSLGRHFNHASNKSDHGDD